MAKVVDRTGERNINNFGSEMVITGYRMNRDMDVYFPEYDWIVRNVQYGNFKKGNVKCPYEPSICGIGYIGEGEYKVSENGKKLEFIKHGVVCYKDVMMKNVKKNILLIKIVKLVKNFITSKTLVNGLIIIITK